MSDQDERRFDSNRRDVLKGLAATAEVSAMGLWGLTGSATAAAPATTPRTEQDTNGNVFLGGDYFELGVRANDGGFSPAVTAPTAFFGSERGSSGIGMYADVDGFLSTANDDPSTPQQEYRYDYFVPGSPEERWSVGYTTTTGTQRTATNGRVVSGNPGGADVTNVPTTLTPASSGNTLAVDLSSSFDSTLDIDQTYSFARAAEFFEVEVTLTNTGSSTIEDVRYQRSVDPDNGVDVGCSFTTKNTVVAQRPSSNRSLVKAELNDSDSCALRNISTIPFFYYSTEPTARVSIGPSSAGLAPNTVVYGANEYDSAPQEGTVLTADVYVAITLDVGSLAPGESKTVVFYTGLTSNIDATLGNIDSCLDERYQGRGTPKDFLCDDVSNDGRNEDTDGDVDEGPNDDYDERNSGRGDERDAEGPGTRDGDSRGSSSDTGSSGGGSSSSSSSGSSRGRGGSSRGSSRGRGGSSRGR